MEKPAIGVKKRMLFFLFCCELACAVLMVRVAYIQTVNGSELQELAYEQQTRDRLISAKRGSILDRNGKEIAVSESANAVSVIHAQIKDEEEAARFLAETLMLDYEEVLEKVKKRVALVRIKSKVENETADIIRMAEIPGIVVDEDIKRFYPYSNLASHVIGFTGSDNQGIIGLEAKYDSYLGGEKGKILTLTDARGLEIGTSRDRVAPDDGGNLVTTLDVVIQQYAEQIISAAVEAKDAKSGMIIVMDPNNGEIYAMALYPNFNLNSPFEINSEELAAAWNSLSSDEKNVELNKMWRNTAINDTYEPGSIFKIITSSAGLEEGVITPESRFTCSGSHTVGGRTIKCWRYPRSHGSESFVEGVRNSCNPVFMAVAERLGADRFYEYMVRFGFTEKTGADLPGEAVGILHKKDDIGSVELATMSFGQSFQITPLQLLRAASAAVNGGYLVTPHIAQRITDGNGDTVEEFKYDKGKQVISEKTSEMMKEILESVVSGGTGNKAYMAGYRVGGKTATSEKLPRRNGKYIASFMAFAPSEAPEIMALVIIDEPKGVYYGGSVAGPVMKELLSNILPYIGIKPVYTEKEAELDSVKKEIVPELSGLSLTQAKEALRKQGFSYSVYGDGDNVSGQFPFAGREINFGAKVLVYTK